MISESETNLKKEENIYPKSGRVFVHLTERTDKIPEKIRGSLIIIAIFVITEPFRLMYILLTDLMPMFEPDVWLFFTTPGTKGYHPFWKAFLVIGLTGHIVSILLSTLIAILFFQKKAIVPKLMIVLFLYSFLFSLLLFFLSRILPYLAQKDSLDEIKNLITLFISVAILITYLITSRRVKSTFVR